MADTKGTWSTVLDVSGRQHGALTRAQVLAAGGSDHWLRRMTGSGELVKVGRTVYAVARAGGGWEQSALVACLDIGPAAVLSHRSAAGAWQLLDWTDDIEVTVPMRCSSRGGRTNVLVHRTRELARPDHALLGRLPVTTPARTLVDLASVLDRDALGTVVEQALGRRLVVPERVLAAISRSSPRGRPGIANLRAVLEPCAGGEAVDSVAEAAFRRAIAQSALPPPVTQYEVRTESGTTMRLDFAWPDQHVALEVESYRWHSGPRSFSRDFIRANRLTALGWHVVRATPSELETHRAGVLSALSRLLSRPS